VRRKTIDNFENGSKIEQADNLYKLKSKVKNFSFIMFTFFYRAGYKPAPAEKRSEPV